MSLYFVGESTAIDVTARVLTTPDGASGDFILVEPFVCPAPHGSFFRREIRMYFRRILDIAEQRGYSSVAMYLPGKNGPKYSFALPSVGLGEMILSYDIDLYVILRESERWDFVEGLYPDFMMRSCDCYSASSRPPRRPFRAVERSLMVESIPDSSDEPPRSLVDLLNRLDDGFAVTLMKLIDARGMDDVECYKKSGVSRQTWYKIMNDKEYRPSKRTVLSFAVALELTLDETRALLATVGFTLSRSLRFDVIVEYFISEGIYDVFTINGVLFAYDLECLGG